jgi:hypothetical protein
MADDAEDVLELETEAPETDEQDAEEQQTDGEPEASEDEPEGETFIGFGDEDEAAPASESESSVIRELRRANRELAKRAAELERATAPKRIEIGDRPTLESCNYDEDAFTAEFDAWNQRKNEVEAQQRAEAEATERQKAEWAERAKAYDADKAKLAVTGYDDAEAEVFSALSNETQALILMTDKPAALVYALHRNPAKLEELSKLNLARAAMQIGKLEDKIKVERRKPLPAPDRPVTGTASAAGSSTHIKRLHEKAQQSGDYSEYLAAKRAAKRDPKAERERLRAEKELARFLARWGNGDAQGAA